MIEHAPESKNRKRGADITANKHGGAKASVRANKRVKPAKVNLRARVYQYILARKERGTVAVRIAKALRKPLHHISGRVSELKADKLVVAYPKMKDRGHIIVAAKFAKTGADTQA